MIDANRTVCYRELLAPAGGADGGPHRAQYSSTVGVIGDRTRGDKLIVDATRVLPVVKETNVPLR